VARKGRDEDGLQIGRLRRGGREGGRRVAPGVDPDGRGCRGCVRQTAPFRASRPRARAISAGAIRSQLSRESAGRGEEFETRVRGSAACGTNVVTAARAGLSRSESDHDQRHEQCHGNQPFRLANGRKGHNDTKTRRYFGPILAIKASRGTFRLQETVEKGGREHPEQRRKAGPLPGDPTFSLHRIEPRGGLLDRSRRPAAA
jgi:hypothetical protein